MREFLGILMMITLANGHSGPCLEYGCPGRPHYEPFVPAPPGHTPNCAKPGQTFCESLDHYPRQLIKFLVDKCSFDFSSALKDESKDDFNVYRSIPDYFEGYDYTPRVEPQLHTQAIPFVPSQYPLREQPALIYGSPSNDTNQNGYARSSRVALRTLYENPLLRYSKLGKTRKRRQSNLDAISLCPTDAQYITPRAALNNQGNWMYVVNLQDQNQKYTQLVKSERCRTSVCNGICSIPAGYTSKCQQQYVQKRLVALEGSGNQLYTDVFWIPHGCSCQIMANYSK
ncbi:spatzle 5 Toll-1 receptor isoform X3 [Andrena cerasifolii]|uniref:spatzle 5 Toll-1 receptor isoform X3 n=1 Tax=Andrena cerasifolii TaxID=2819439 RepID=UPI004037EFB6